MKVLITGITGFAGSHLAERLLDAGHEVSGVTLPEAPRRNLEGMLDRIRLHDCRLTIGELNPILGKTAPDWVFHLAGQAHVGRAWQDREETFATNVQGTITVLNAVSDLPTRPKLLVVSSGEIYGEHGAPFTEESRVSPATPYALSKSMAEQATIAYAAWDDLPAYVARPFNHIGPRQAPTFVSSEFARQLARIKRGLCPPTMQVGNLDAARDFSDVRDIVAGYCLILEKGEPGRPYNLSSGQAITIRTILDTLIELSGLQVDVTVDEGKLRKLDAASSYGDSSRAREELGYAPTYPLAETLQDLYRYWLDQVSQ